MIDINRTAQLRKTPSRIFLLVSTLSVLMLLPIKITLPIFVGSIIATGVAAYRLDNHLLSVMSIALLFRIGIILADTTLGILPTPPISPGHNQRAIELASAWSQGQFVGVLQGTDLMRVFMAHVLAPFYLLFGQSQLSGRIGIALISPLIGYLVYHLAIQAVNRRMSLLATSAVLFWPTVVYRSVVIQREIVIVVALLGFLWVAVRWLETISILNLAVALTTTATIFALRKENLVLIAAITGVIFLIKSRDKPYYLAVTILLTVPFLMYFVLNFQQFTGFGSTLSPAALDAFAYGRAHGDTAYLVGIHYSTWIDVLLYAPLKVIYFLYTPFPWHIETVTELVVGMSAATLLIVTGLSRRGIAILKNRPYYLSLLLSYLITGIVSYSIIEMNYGAAVRRRIQFVPILIILAVIGISNIQVKIRGT